MFLNQNKIPKMGFLAILILSIALLEIFLLKILVSVIWPADEIEKYPSQTHDFLNADLHAKAKDGENIVTIQGDVHNFRVICTYPEEGTDTKRKGGNGNWSGNANEYLNCSRIVGSEMMQFALDSAHFIKLLSAIRSDQKVLRVSIDVVQQAVPVELVAEKIQIGNSTTGSSNNNGPATPIKNVMYTTTSTPLASTSTSMSTPQIPSPETIPKQTLETLLIQNGRINNNSYTPRKPAESTTTLKLKITGRWGFFFSERF